MKKNETVVQAATTNHETVDEFLLTSWVSFYDTDITPYEEQLADLARSGLNWIINPLWIKNQFQNKVQLSNVELNEMYAKYNMGFMAPLNGTYEEMVEDVVGNDLQQCLGYYVKDEASVTELPTYAEAVQLLKELDDTRFSFSSLFPNYAGAANLGGSYEEYVQNWVDLVGTENLEYLIFDHYPFTAYEDVRASFFSDLETVRKVAYENNRMKTTGCPQLGWWNGMRKPTMDEVRWDYSAHLAYGMKGLIQFNWAAPDNRPIEEGGEGMRDFVLDQYGNRTELYEPCQILNWQTRQIGQILMKFDVAHAYHTGTEIAMGVETLPKSFVFQPDSSADNLIFSLGYSKDNADKYVVVMNNERSLGKQYTIHVDKTAGVDSLTYYKVDDFKTLPNYMEELAAPTEETIDISSGSFTVDLQPGEMRVYKLNGNVSIKEPLAIPTFSLKSGTHIGAQTLEIQSRDEGAEIYYTTDGSYPTIFSNHYRAPIRLSGSEDFNGYTIQAIAVRGDEITEAAVGEYIISDASRNVCLGRIPTFSKPIVSATGNGSEKTVTDGAFDPMNTAGTVDGETTWCTVDFGDVYVVDKVKAKMWHDWYFEDVVIQLATDKDFTENVYTVYSNDADNSLGVGVGNVELYKEVPGGHSWSFDPRAARYVRVYNISASTNERRSLFEEIQVYTTYDAGNDLLADASDWKITGGGTWTHENGVVKQTGTYNTVTWDKSYTYTAKKYKNFMIDATVSIDHADPSAWGYVGFGMYKPEIDNVQSNVDKGYYVAIEPKGRVLLWNGKKPELGPEDANIAGFAVGSDFNIKVVSVGDTISVSVNNKPVMFVRGENLNREAGYISIHAGLLPCTVSKLLVTELPTDSAMQSTEVNLVEGGDYKIAVDRFIPKADIIRQLPTQMLAKDNFGKTYSVNVEWDSDVYDRTKTGFFTFTGKFVDLPVGVVNKRDAVATAQVFVKPDLDRSELAQLIATAQGLSPEHFTADSFAQVTLKLDAALDIISDPYMLENDIGVAIFQLYNAIHTLVSTVDKTELSGVLEEVAALDTTGYTEKSVADLNAAVAEAQAVLADALSTPEVISAASVKVVLAKQSMVKQVEVKGPAQKPTPAKDLEETNVGLSVALGCGIGVATLGAAALVVGGVKKKRK